MSEYDASTAVGKALRLLSANSPIAVKKGTKLNRVLVSTETASGTFTLHDGPMDGNHIVINSTNLVDGAVYDMPYTMQNDGHIVLGGTVDATLFYAGADL